MFNCQYILQKRPSLKERACPSIHLVCWGSAFLFRTDAQLKLKKGKPGSGGEELADQSGAYTAYRTNLKHKGEAPLMAGMLLAHRGGQRLGPRMAQKALKPFSPSLVKGADSVVNSRQSI
jgi:hypothetical protein